MKIFKSVKIKKLYFKPDDVANIRNKEKIAVPPFDFKESSINRLVKCFKAFLIIVVLVLPILFITSCSSRIMDYKGYDEKPPGSNEDLNIPLNSKKIILKIIYDISATDETSKIEFISTIPADYEYRQEVLNYDFSIEPAGIYSANGNTYAKFIINDPPEYFTIDIDTEMRIFDFDLAEALNTGEKIQVAAAGADKVKEYTGHEENLEVDSQAIQDMAETFSATDRLELVREIYDFVLEHMTYHGYDPDDNGAAVALAEGEGDCTEYSDLFVALCRAKNIPARVIEGYVADADPGELTLGHNWSEVYLEDMGWIPFDTTYDDNNGDSDSTTFDNLKNIYVYTGFVRNDEELFNYHYYYYIYYGHYIVVTKEVSVMDV